MDKFLAYDTETGGLLAKEHSLLTLYMGSFVFDQGKFSLRRDLDLKIKPNEDDCYKVTAGALKVNKIDLVKHDREAITIDQAAEKVYYFLKEESQDGNVRLVRSGHNEPFDKDFVVSNLLKEMIFRKFTDYHTIDTVVIGHFLKFKGLIPRNQSLKLSELAKFFGISVSDQELHTAKGDTHTHIRVLERMISL